MRPTYLILFMSVALSAAEEIALKADRVEHVLVLKQVYLNDQGPFRMMIDTGAASCLIRPALAKRLGLRPVYAVEQETVAGVKRVPTAMFDDVRIGLVSDHRVEVMITDVKLPGVDGVLGQSWLVRHDYLLDYRGRRLVLDASAPERGVRAALRTSDGRPGISADVNGHRQDLVIDSGASVLILFGRSAVAGGSMVLTNSGSVEAGTGSARVTIGGSYNRVLTTAEFSAPPQPGLLPAAAFNSVYISNRDGLVVLVP